MNCHGHGRQCELDGFKLSASGYQIDLAGNASLSFTAPRPTWSAHISEASLHTPTVFQLLSDMNIKHTLPSQLSLLGRTSLRGDFSYSGNDHFSGKGHLSSDVGTADVSIQVASQQFTSEVSTPHFDMSGLLPNLPLGVVSANIELSGSWPIRRDMTLTAQGDVDLLEYDGHRYQNISLNGTYHQQSFDGTLSMDAPDGQVDFKDTPFLPHCLRITQPTYRRDLRFRHHRRPLRPQLGRCLRNCRNPSFRHAFGSFRLFFRPFIPSDTATSRPTLFTPEQRLRRHRCRGTV